MPDTVIIAAIFASIMMGGFVVNEATHGGLAEGMGLGHHHMTDHGGYHCAHPEGPDWDRHVEHMHGQGAHCGHGHMDGQGHHGMGGMG